MIFSNQGSEGRRALPMRFRSLSLWARAASQTKSMISRLNVKTASVVALGRVYSGCPSDAVDYAERHLGNLHVLRFAPDVVLFS